MKAKKLSGKLCNNYHADSVGTATNFAAVGKMFTSVRKGNSVADNWKEEIDKDYNKRKK